VLSAYDYYFVNRVRRSVGVSHGHRLVWLGSSLSSSSSSRRFDAVQLWSNYPAVLLALRATNDCTQDTLHTTHVIHEKAHEAWRLPSSLIVEVTMAAASQNTHQSRLMISSVVRMSELSSQLSMYTSRNASVMIMEEMPVKRT